MKTKLAIAVLAVASLASVAFAGKRPPSSGPTVEVACSGVTICSVNGTITVSGSGFSGSSVNLQVMQNGAAVISTNAAVSNVGNFSSGPIPISGLTPGVSATVDAWSKIGKNWVLVGSSLAFLPQ